jgi:pimeloyl-ACP methyl ester carboxylesterase
MSGARRVRVRVRAGKLAVVLAGLVCAASASAQTYAPPNQPGPPLSVPAASLSAALYCPKPLVRGELAVLLIAGTGATPSEQYSWNYEPGLNDQGIAWCAVTLPNHELSDDQIAGEYVVYAIRAMFAATARRIDIIGHSQGGMIFRWPLRFWPDTRAMVDDAVSLAGDNHGTQAINELDICAQACVAAAWEQRPQAPFIAALNSGAETFPGISYTDVYTETDELSTPNDNDLGTTSLHTGAGTITNVAIQSVCPLDVDEHALLGTVDPVGFALALDAIEHPGPADPSRIPKSVCNEKLLPGTDLTSPYVATVLTGFLYLGSALTPLNIENVTKLAAEPPLDCYVYATCSGAGAPTLTLAETGLLRRARRSRIGVLVRTLEGNALVPVPGATVSLAGRRVLTGPGGRATLTMKLKRAGAYRLTAARQGCNSATKRLRLPA